jgi:hypothetical protein
MRSSLAVLALAAALAALPAAATPPRTLSYQGFLTSSANAPIDAPVQMTFSIYSTSTGGVALWSETQASVAVAKGEFSTVLGLSTPLALAFDAPYYMGVAVGADPEMTPRQPLASSAYAFRALSIDSGAMVPGSVLTGSIPTATLPGSQVTGDIPTATLPGTQITGSITTATIPGSHVTGDLSGIGNIVLAHSNGSVGTIFKNSSSFLHDFGAGNTFVGLASGNFTLTGNNNTGVGQSSLVSNTTGFSNVAVGHQALFQNADGVLNTAVGDLAMFSNTSGSSNVGVGGFALAHNTTGQSNVGIGSGAVQLATTSSDNIGIGNLALTSATTGGNNIAIGTTALSSSTTGTGNVAIGKNALNAVINGLSNIAIGSGAGSAIIAHNNIMIANAGTAADNAVIRIGTQFVQAQAYLAGVNGVTTGNPAVNVVVDANGQLGTVISSRAVKEDIADMGNASDILLKLRPVTFHYKQRPGWPLQYGLIAEEVAEVAPDLAARGPDGKVQTVYYQDLPPMLLNEYQKQQRVIEAQRAQLAAEHARVDALERELAAMKARLGWD